MRKVLLGCAALVCSSGLAMAGQPMLLNDAQMDRVTAGFNGNGIETNVVGCCEILSGLVPQMNPTGSTGGPLVFQVNNSVEHVLALNASSANFEPAQVTTDTLYFPGTTGSIPGDVP